MEKAPSESAKKDSPMSKGKDNLEVDDKDISESENKSEMESSSSKIKSTKNISEIKKEKEKTDSDSKKNPESDALKLEDSNQTYASVLKRSERVSSELEEREVPNPSELEEEKRIQNEDIELEDNALELEDKLIEGTLQLEEQSEGNIDKKENIYDEATLRVEETEVPLLVGESVSINMHGASSTVHVHTKDNKEGNSNKSESPYLSPIRRIRKAWDKSTNVFDFILRATLIIFSTLGWILCIGGVPFVSIAMFIIGSVYIDECKVQPNIPIYLIVGGVCGTIQHFIAFWNKCISGGRKGRLSAYQVYYNAVDGAMTLFLLIWFIIGCVWVYGVQDVEFEDTDKDKYCHKTLYYFSFWLLNFSFMLIALVAVLSLCLLLFVIVSPKKEAVV